MLLIRFGVVSCGLAAAHAADHPDLALIHFDAAPRRILWSELLQDLNSRTIDSTQWQFLALDDFQTDWLGSLVLVEVRGSCEVPKVIVQWRPQPLGWINIVDGEWAPFIFVDCVRIAEAVRRAVGSGGGEPDVARAMAIVIRHELMHWTRQSRVHDSLGEFRAALPASDLRGVASLGSRSPQ